MSAALIFGLLFALMLTGMPISISLGLTVLTFLFTMTEVPIESVGLKLFSGLDNFGIMAIPFFILAGTFLTRGGVARRMIAFTTSLVGHLPGGLGLAGVAACAMFAAISGSSVATVVAIGSIMMPAMVEHGYPRRFGVGVIRPPARSASWCRPRSSWCCTGFRPTPRSGRCSWPASSPVSCWRRCWRPSRGSSPGATAIRGCRASLMQQWTAFRESVWGLLLIVIVLGGIYGGIFTPTEAAAVAAVYAFFITVFVYKELKLREVFKVLLQATSMSSMLLYIITNAVLFSFLMTHEQIPQEMAAWIIDTNPEPMGVPPGGERPAPDGRQRHGSVVDPSDHGADLVSAGHQDRHSSGSSRRADDREHRSRTVPPTGAACNLYIASGIAKMGISEITIAVLPWLLAMLVFLGLITYIPEISLWLPRLLGMI